MEKVLHTKWGNAILTEYGYYRISTLKEGYHNKMLHRFGKNYRRIE